MKRGRDWPTPIKYDCEVVERTVAVDSESEVFLCNCEAWLPVPVGKVGDFDSLDAVWQSPIAQRIIQDVTARKFTWCAVETCGIYQDHQRQSRVNLWINIDNSCNLACPSCRRDLLMIDSGEIFEQKTRDVAKVIDWLERFDRPILVTMSGSGDALASHITRPLLLNYRAHDNVAFRLKTNGLLLEKIMSRSTVRDNIENYNVSVDAASQEVYEDVRRPGRWAVLMRNLEWLSSNKRHAGVSLNFTVQTKNFQDMPAFQSLCRHFDFHCNFTPLDDWGTWTSSRAVNPDAWTEVNGIYSDHNVTCTSHPQHDDFLRVFRSLDFDDRLNTFAPRLLELL